jgi:hypothetical protein
VTQEEFSSFPSSLAAFWSRLMNKGIIVRTEQGRLRT